MDFGQRSPFRVSARLDAIVHERRCDSLSVCGNTMLFSFVQVRGNLRAKLGKDDVAKARIYEAGEFQFTPSQFRRISRSRKIEFMVTWFRERYEDPAENMPYESGEGGYSWIWGGPYNADDEIQSEFSDVADFDTMQEAVEEIQADGIFDWAPISPPDDIYDEDEPGHVLVDENGSRLVDDRGNGILIEQPDQATLREAMLGRLDDLETKVGDLLANQSMIGHNNPPGPIMDPPVSRQELEEVRSAVEGLRAEAFKTQPNEQAVTEKIGTLRRVAANVTKWLLTRAEKGVDSFVTTAGASIGVAVGAWITGYGSQLHDALIAAANAAGSWLQSFTW